MRFYNTQHQFYCGIDFHARRMDVCLVSHDGELLVHRHLKAAPEPCLKAIAPYRAGLVVAVDCTFTWYGLADLCAQEDLPFVLGHALSMKAIHGGKAQHDQIDSHKIATLLRGGMLPHASVDPAARRATRDLLRRRTHLMRTRAALVAHVQHTNSQSNLPDIGKTIASKANREGVAERFDDPAVQKTIAIDLELITSDDQMLSALALLILNTATHHEAQPLYLLQTVPGIGTILSRVLRYEIHQLDRCPRVQDFASSGRLVTCATESGGKRVGTSGNKIGNAHLKGALSAAATRFLRGNEPGQKYLARWENTQANGKALSILAHQLARAVYVRLKRQTTVELAPCLCTSGAERVSPAPNSTLTG